MKIRNKLLAVLSGALLMIALAACDHGSQDSQPSGRTGTVRVLVDHGQPAQANSRTAVPEDLLCNAYTLTFTAGGKSSVTFSLTESAGEVVLELGTWSLSVVGSRDDINIAESDPIPVTVPSDGTLITVTVPVHPVKDGPPGEFSYRISAEGLTDISAALQGVGDAGQSEIDLNIGEEASVSIAPGYYRLTVRASLEGQKLIRREMIHIYPNTRTYKGYELTEEDFVFAPPDYEGIKNALESAVGGVTVADPVPLKLRVDLADGGWESILSAVESVGKYVALDLSACTMDETGLDTGTGNTGADKVVDLVLPNTANSIWRAGTYSSFQDFTVLASLSGAGVETVGDYAFYSCYSLESVDLPVATSIGYRAFQYCSSLATVSLPVATSIGGGAFQDCSSLASVSLPMATSIGSGAFQYCSSLASVSLPAATSIGSDTFRGRTSLESVDLPAATSIGDYAFDGCTSLATVSLPMATSIGNYAFYYCDSLETVSLPAATSIGYRAFYGTSLVSVSLPVATSIGDLAFQDCSSLASVDLPAATSIGYHAFYGTSLTSIALPASLTTIDGNPFYGCVNLTTITIDPANPAFTIHDGMLLDKEETTLIAYLSASGSVTLPGIITIDESAFWGCDSLESVSLPAATSIGDLAFDWCESLASVSLPAATSIGYRAFYNTSLVSVSLPAATSIGDLAFGACTSLASVDLPAATSIGWQAFVGCTSLASVSLPMATSIGNYAFQYCESLASVSLPMATSIGWQAFSECQSLTEVSLPVATSIGGGAFMYCSSLVSVALPVATSIGTDGYSTGAFHGCASLTTVSLPAAISIDQYTFMYCSSLVSVALPAATSIGYSAFFECNSLASVDLSAATSILDRVFYGCISLTSVSLPVMAPPISTGPSYGIFVNTGADGTITVSVPAGAISAYTSAWAVDAETPAGGNTSKYGDNHKAVLITDAAQ